MPDISMCENNQCPKKEECYRFKAAPNTLQSYGSFKYENGKCDYIMPLNPYKEN